MTELGIVILFKFEQFWNAEMYMYSTELGMVTLIKPDL